MLDGGQDAAEPIDLQEGDPFELYTASPTTGLRGVDVNYAGLARDVAVGATVLVDSGLIRMRVVEKNETSLCCRVTTAGKLGARRHINLPGVHVNLPSLTEKDEQDIRVGVAAGCDFFALSFVRRGEDIPSNHSPFYAPQADTAITVGVDALVAAARATLD